jgi:tape measure domain-containing protein
MSGVEIRVRANTTQARGELQKLEKSVGKIQSVTSGLASSIKSAIAAYSGFISVKGIVAAADSLTNLENRIALVTGRGKESQAALQQLFAIAARGRTSIQTTAATFNRFGLALSDAGKSTEDILAVTEAVAKAATLSGASAESAQAAIVQLGQGLASGQLRGEELNSVLEQTPRIAQAIADGMGIPFGELREQAKEGLITSEAVFNALIDQIGVIEKEFETLEPTVGSLTVIMRDEFTRALGAIDNIGGFSESARSKIILLTEAFRFIADRAEINFIKVNLLLINLRQDFISTFNSIKETVSSLFDADFNYENFKTSISESIASLKEFLGVGEQAESDSTFEKLFKVPSLDLSGYLPNLIEIEEKLTAFADNVIAIFKRIFVDVIEQSWWSDLFWKGEDQIGGSKFLSALSNVTSKLRSWSQTIIGFFKDIFAGTRGINEFGEAGRGSRSGGIVGYFEGGTEAIKGFTTAISEAITESAALNTAFDFFTELPNTISNATQAINDYIKAQGGIVGIKDNVVNDLLGEDLSAFGDEGRSEGRIERGLSTLEENKYLIGGGLLAAGFAYKFPEVASNLLQGSFFVLGAAAAGAFIQLVKNPIVIALGAIAFGPQVLTAAAESGAARKLGEAIGTGIVAFFETDAEGQGVLKRILDAILLASGEFGAGLIDGLNLAFTDAVQAITWADELAGVFALSLVGITSVGILRNGMTNTAKSIASGIFGSAFGTAGKASLGVQIANIFGLVDDETVKNSAKKKGNKLGKLFGTALAGSIAQVTADQLVPDDALGGLGEALDGAIGGAVAGAQLGAVGGPLGVAIGAAVGGAVGLAFDVFNNEQLMSSIRNIGTKLYEIVVVDLPKAIVEGFNKATDGVKSWFKGIFSGDSSTNPIEGYSNLNQEDFLKIAGQPIRGNASGGYISGPGGPRDDKIPAMLSNGEFVIQASAVKKFGAGFLSMLNQGIMPRGFMDGGFVTLNNDKRTFEAEIKKQKQILGAAEKSGDDSKVKLAVKAIEDAEKGLALVEAQLAKYDENGNLIVPTGAIGGTGTKGGAGGGADGDKTQGETLAEGFQEDFRRGFYEALRSGDFSEFAKQLGDSFTNRVIESFSTGFTDSLFKGLKLDENLEKLFDGVEDFAGDIGTKISETILGAFSKSESGDGSLLKSLGDMAKSLFDSMSGLLKGAFDSLKGLFSGGGLGGGGFSLGGLTNGIGSFFSGFGELPIFDGLFGGPGLGFFGANNGGIVPNTPYSQIGKDSVPAMLTPGELVVPADKVKGFGKENKGSQQTFNINVSGDVSRQTRKEIVKMLPEITSGVNMVNKENNFRR